MDTAEEASEESPRTLDPILEEGPDGDGAGVGTTGTGTTDPTGTTGVSTVVSTTPSGTTTTGPTTMTMQPPTDETVPEGDEEAHEVGSSSEASSPKRILRSPYSQAVGQALWSGRMRWGDSLPEDLVPSRDEYPDATWPTWTEDESDPAASGSGHAVEPEVPACRDGNSCGAGDHCRAGGP